MSVNKVILVGNVGADPRFEYVGSRPYATMTLATTEPAVAGAGGEMVPERTEWHRLVMWDANAETAERYITKGTKLYVEGKLRTRAWLDRNAIKRTVTEIVVDTLDILQRARQGEGH